MIANEEFRAAFAAVRDEYATLASTVTALEPAVFARARAAGVEVERRDGWLTIGGAPQRADQAAPLRAVIAHLDGERYREVRAALQ